MMQKNILAILLVGISNGAFATTQTMDPEMMMKMMQFMYTHPEVASQMMQTVSQKIENVAPIKETVNSDDLQAEFLDDGKSIRELNLNGYDFGDKDQLDQVVQFFTRNKLINLKTIDLCRAQNVDLFFNRIFSQECTVYLESLQWIKASYSNGLIPDHVSNVLFRYVETYSQCTRDMRKWSDRHGNIIAAFIRVDVDGIETFKNTPLWKGILTKPIKIVYRSQEDADMAPVIIRTEG